VSQAPGIVDGLLRQLPADWPAAVVQAATSSRERCGLTTLSNLPAMLQREGFGSPAVLVIGRVLEASTLAQAEALLTPPAARAAG
jgi:uroporphyrin-III C-methyltransferase